MLLNTMRLESKSIGPVFSIFEPGRFGTPLAVLTQFEAEALLRSFEEQIHGEPKNEEAQ